jgi:hypothetical protein
MRIVFNVLHATVSLWIAGCTFHFFWVFLNGPQRLREINARCDGSFKGKAFAYIYLFSVFIGICICVYDGALAAFSWMPRSWVTTDEDGASYWIAQTLAGTFSLAAGIGLVDGMIKAATDRLNTQEQLEHLQREKWGQHI